MGVTSASFLDFCPVINASGDRIAFSVFEKDKRVVYASAPGGTPEKMCEGCLRATDWSRDEKTLLVFAGNPYQIDVLDVASHQHTPLLKGPQYHLLYGRFSPDNRWVSFTIRTGPNRGQIVIAPIDGPKPVPENAWIPITASEPQDWANCRPMGTCFTSPPAATGIAVSGDSDSTQVPTGPPARLSRYNIFTGAWLTGNGVGLQRAGGSDWG